MAYGRPLIVLATALAFAAPASAAAAAGGDDPNWFLITIESSGSGSADYGRERLEPETNHNASVGVDGTTSLNWTWRIRAVAVSRNGGPVGATAANFSGFATQANDVLTWSWMNGTLTETAQCRPGEGPPPYASTYHPGSDGTEPDWLGSPRTGVVLSGRGFEVRTGYDLRDSGGLFSCAHALPPHGLALYEDIAPADAPIRRGDFDPSSSKTFRRVYGDDVAVGTDHSSSDLNAAHTAVGSSRLEVKVDAVGARKAKRKDERYSEPLTGAVVPGCVPEAC